MLQIEFQNEKEEEVTAPDPGFVLKDMTTYFFSSLARKTKMTTTALKFASLGCCEEKHAKTIYTKFARDDKSGKEGENKNPSHENSKHDSKHPVRASS